MNPLIEELVSVPFTLRPGLKPIKEPTFNRTLYSETHENPEPIGSAEGLAGMRAALGCWLLTHRLISNDIVWMTVDGRIEALKVNSPSGWEPTEKLFMSFAEIHNPLPNSASVLKQAFPSILKLVSKQWYERTVWTLAPNAYSDQRPTKRELYSSRGEGWHGPKSKPCFRYERQQIGPAPAVGEGILFTIDVQVILLEDLGPDDIAFLKQALESMPADVREYKGLAGRIL